jgi:anti-anti-sigma regulatory factor
MSNVGLTKVGTLWWIRLTGSLSQDDLRSLAVLTGRLGTKPPSKVLLDFSRVRHLDFRGGCHLLAATRLVRLRGGDVVVIGLTAYVWNLLRLGVAQETDELIGNPERAMERPFDRLEGASPDPVSAGGWGMRGEVLMFSPPSLN